MLFFKGWVAQFRGQGVFRVRARRTGRVGQGDQFLRPDGELGGSNPKVAMGKFNEKENEWEAGDDIPNGLYGDIFKDPGAKSIYVRITYRADLRGIGQVLVRRIGEKDKK